MQEKILMTRGIQQTDIMVDRPLVCLHVQLNRELAQSSFEDTNQVAVKIDIDKRY